MKRKVGYMDMQLYRKVIDEVSEYPEEVKKKELELFHFGESLLHPEISEMNAYASNKGMNTVLSVNAPELTPVLAEKFIRGNAYKIIISLDGFDAESFKQIRGRQINYNAAISNVLAVKEAVLKYKSSTQLLVRMIAMKSNSHKIDDFTHFWQKNDINVEIRDFYPWGEKNMEHLGEYEKYPPFMICPFAWQYVVVQWNGDVVACCRDYNTVNLMGNVKNESLTDIWNGKAYTEFRKNMISGDYKNPICGPCMDLYYTED